MAVVKRTIEKVGNIMYVACLVGISIGIGGSILLYRFVKRWLHENDDEPTQQIEPKMNADDCCSDSNANNTVRAQQVELQTSDDVGSCTDDSLVQHQAAAERSDDVTTLRRRHRGFHGDSDEHVNSAVAVLTAGSHLPLDTSPSLPGGEFGIVVNVQAPVVNGDSLPETLRETVDHGCLSMEHVQQVDMSTFDLCDHDDGAFLPATTAAFSDIPQDTAVESCSHHSRYSLDRQSLPPCHVHFHHSTPDERESHQCPTTTAAAATLACENISYDTDNEAQLDVANSLSWHDYFATEPAPSRSCISLDDSIFLRDFAFEGFEALTAGCTAVTSLEQLEQEVAGVLSDCGDLERCVGALRKRDSHKAVAGRYSLGVADSVMLAERRHAAVMHGAPFDPRASPIIDETSLSSSAVAAGRDSGYLWDDDGFSPELSAGCNTSVRRRVTRSLSPQPVNQRHKHYSTRNSLGICVDSQLTDVEQVSASFTVTRRLSGRHFAFAQHSKQ